MSAQERYKNTAKAVINKHVGRNAVDVKHVAEHTGITCRKLYALKEGTQQPNATDIGLLTELLGPEFLQELFQPAGVVEVVTEQQPITNGHLVMSVAANTTSQIADCLNDERSPGRIDHQERAQLMPQARKAIRTLRAFVANQAHPARRAAE